MTDISKLYEPGPADDAHARVLVTFFDGAMDAGGAGRMAVSQLLRSLPTVRASIRKNSSTTAPTAPSLPSNTG